MYTCGPVSTLKRYSAHSYTMSDKNQEIEKNVSDQTGVEAQRTGVNVFDRVVLYCCVEGMYRLRQQIRQYQIGMKLSKQKKRLELAIKLYVGNVIAEYNDNILIIHGEFVSHQLMIPKSSQFM